MVTEMIEAYKESRKETAQHRKDMQEVELQSSYLKLQSEALKLVSDMKKLNITADDLKKVIGKPF